MRLCKAQVQNYRSIRDTGPFEVEKIKTILVGPNEAGKTAILQALQQLHPPKGIKPFNPIRDYPRALYNDIATGKIKPSDIKVVTGWFDLEDDDLELLPESLRTEDNKLCYTRRLDNSCIYGLTKAPKLYTFGAIKSDLLRLAAHLDRDADAEGKKVHSDKLTNIAKTWNDKTELRKDTSKPLREWLESAITLIDENATKEIERRDRLAGQLNEWVEYRDACDELVNHIPTFVLFSNIYRVRPIIHLAHLAHRLASGTMDDDLYDYGNSCLLKLLGFTAQKLSELGAVGDPGQDNVAFERFREQLDNRNYQLNAASIKLSQQIKSVWNPNEKKGEASKLRLIADGQYLKVVVEDNIGVEVELDQRSEGFQWLVSFFVVFFSEADEKHANSILLLDEPGVSLHALKQRDFRNTIGTLAERNQTIYTTHSPFMVGPDELDLVRVVEMVDREVGTKIHTSVTSSDPAAILPLQEALGYDLAQSLFSQQKNLICEGLTDYWYVEATSALLSASGHDGIGDKIALIPSNTASKVVYFGTILTAHNLKVAALLDSDQAGDLAAKQDILVHKLGAKRILRTADYTNPKIPKAEIEDLLRDTLTNIAKKEFEVDLATEIKANPTTPFVDLLETKAAGAISKYKLAKAFVRWTRDHSASDLTGVERSAWENLIAAINGALK